VARIEKEKPRPVFAMITHTLARPKITLAHTSLLAFSRRMKTESAVTRAGDGREINKDLIVSASIPGKVAPTKKPDFTAVVVGSPQSNGSS
jgi:hypothetical protein